MSLHLKSGTDEDNNTWGGVEDVATIAPETIYRVEIITEVGEVKKRMNAVYDMQYQRSQSQGKGAWLYVREE